MRLHNVYLLVRNDGEEYEVYDSKKDAKDRLIELARQSEDISEMHEQLIRSQGFFMESSLNQIEIIKNGRKTNGFNRGSVNYIP